jgi:hypothetical protein
MDELELIYRNLKPGSEANSVSSYSGSFPGGAHVPGYNPSSDPAGTAYTSTSPAQTNVTAFHAGQGQDFSFTNYITATERDATTNWIQAFLGSSAGRQFSENGNKTSTAYAVRPVRRLILTPAA